jgi:hypothetical protein
VHVVMAATIMALRINERRARGFTIASVRRGGPERNANRAAKT